MKMRLASMAHGWTRPTVSVRSSLTIRKLTCSSTVWQVAKPSIQAIGQLRKLVPGTSMIKARDALLASRLASNPDQDDVTAALAWLEQDREKSGAQKAKKVASRVAREGVIAVSVLTDGMPSMVESSDNLQLNQQAVQAGISVTSHAQASMVEINCETDFVARNEVFVQLVRDIAHTAALFPSLAGEPTTTTSPPPPNDAIKLVNLSVDALLAFPLLPSSPEAASTTTTTTSPKTVATAILDTISCVGEKISLARACAIQPATIPLASAPRRSETGQEDGNAILDVASAFAHGGSSFTTKINNKPGYMLTAGRVASLLVTRMASPQLSSALSNSNSNPLIQDSARALVRSLARQTAGLNTTCIRSTQPQPQSQLPNDEPSQALYSQPFMMLLPAASPFPESNSLPVQQVLEQWAESKGLNGQEVVQVVELKRWEIGETAQPVDENVDSFAQEVRKAAGLE